MSKLSTRDFTNMKSTMIQISNEVKCVNTMAKSKRKTIVGKALEASINIFFQRRIQDSEKGREGGETRYLLTTQMYHIYTQMQRVCSIYDP